MAKAPEEAGSFSTPSADSVPTASDIRRLERAKVAHEQRLKVLRARQRIRDQEVENWKDMKLLQRRSNDQARFAQWQREVRKEDQLQLQREVADYHEALKERARNVRASLQNTQGPRLEIFRANKMVAQQIREDSHRLLEDLKDVRKQSHESKLMQVEVRKQQCKQQRLRRQLEAQRREELRQEVNVMRYARLQQEMQRTEQDLAELEQQEIDALSRLQRSQSARESVISQLSPAEEAPAAHREASSGRFAPIDDEETPTSAPEPAPAAPEEVPQGLGVEEKRRPKQPRGYGFSPKTRRASTGPRKAREVPSEAQ